MAHFMEHSDTGKQVRLTVFENEPLARLAAQRLQQEDIRCVVRSLGMGPGGLGVATYLPHALFVNSTDEMIAREVLGLAPAEIAEREKHSSQPDTGRFALTVLVLMVMGAAVLFGLIELMS